MGVEFCKVLFLLHLLNMIFLYIVNAVNLIHIEMLNFLHSCDKSCYIFIQHLNIFIKFFLCVSVFKGRLVYSFLALRFSFSFFTPPPLLPLLCGNPSLLTMSMSLCLFVQFSGGGGGGGEGGV